MDEEWLPIEGIEMWYWKDDKTPNLPTGLPKKLPMMEMKQLQEVCNGLKKYLKFFKYVQQQSAEQARSFWNELISYWIQILTVLEDEKIQYIEESHDLVHGFWPISKWRNQVPMQFRSVACELEAQVQYIGPKRNKPCESF
jgi:hypothetical protein